MIGFSIAIPPRREMLGAEVCERFARHCGDGLARAREPKVCERLARERSDWLAFAASRTSERSVRVIERLRSFRVTDG